MNKCENIFDRVQKRTPFRTPAGFFEQQEQTLKQAVSHQQIVNRKWWYAAAASVILIGGIYGITRLLMLPSAGSDIYTRDIAPIYSQTSSSSGEWSDFAEADIFMDNMNW